MNRDHNNIVKNFNNMNSVAEHAVTEVALIYTMVQHPIAVVPLLQEPLVNLVAEPLLRLYPAARRREMHPIQMMAGLRLMISLRLKMKMMKEMCLSLLPRFIKISYSLNFLNVVLDFATFLICVLKIIFLCRFSSS